MAPGPGSWPRLGPMPTPQGSWTGWSRSTPRERVCTGTTRACDGSAALRPPPRPRPMPRRTARRPRRTARRPSRTGGCRTTTPPGTADRRDRPTMRRPVPRVVDELTTVETHGVVDGEHTGDAQLRVERAGGDRGHDEHSGRLRRLAA